MGLESKKDINQKYAYIYAVTAIFLWSTVATAFKISLEYLDFLQLLFYSSALSCGVFFIIIIIQKKLYLLAVYSKKDFLWSAFLGFLNPFLYYVILFKAYSILPAQEAQSLNYTWPVMLVILSIPLLKQKITLRSIAAVAVSFLGVVIISTRGDFTSLKLSDPFGVALAVGSSVIWAFFWICNMKDKRDEVVKLFLNFLFGLVFIFIAVFFFSEVMVFEIRGILGAAYVGLFEMGITFVLWLKALSLSETTAKISNLVFLSPFISLLFISLIIKEKILLSTITGLVFIISGIVMEKWKKKPAKNNG